MLKLTSAAADFISRLRKQHGFSAVDHPRISSDEERVCLGFASHPEAADVVAVYGDQLVFLAPRAAARLDNATIDARPEKEETILVIREPIGVPAIGNRPN